MAGAGRRVAVLPLELRASGVAGETSIFGLARWPDYHYYYGHVMWDIETFSVPALTLLYPSAARTLLEYRSSVIPAARANAKLNGYDGLQFPWESGPTRR